MHKQYIYVFSTMYIQHIDQSVRRILPVFLLLLILVCAAPASSRGKVLSTGTFRDPLEKWGSM